jgi:hypothetical protein
MTEAQKIAFLHTVKGAPALVLLALSSVGRAMTNRELQLFTGYAEENVSHAISLLVAMGFVTMKGPRGPWSLAPGVPLQWIESAGTDPGNIGDPSSSSSSILNNDSEDEEEEEKDPEIAEIHDFLLASGIHEPAATTLARLPYVTKEYIQDHLAWARSKKNGIGTAIDRMKKHWEVPRDFKNPTDDYEERHKYIKGEFADYINY